MAFASSACGGDEGSDSGPGLDVERSAVGAPLQGSNESCPEGPHSFNELKGSLEDLPVDCVPSWTEAQLSDGFEAIRDTRLQALALPEQPDFPRRIPWLEPENGCEERAPAAVYILHESEYPTPWYARVQSRENAGLTLVTENEPDGSVSWSHHVAPVVRVGGGYRPWAELLRRTFALDVLECPACKGRMKLVAIPQHASLGRRKRKVSTAPPKTCLPAGRGRRRRAR
ncbi:protein-glutamine glutaminase family protein [Sorangium sp. So ce887]|uniref:protein-glutamine glutaminase family protein n=1 Tax=Sorangium sp. So ce887 TaxID=3133324 RepID=UPI003F618D4B